jgi:uncharacterized membrane protein YcaP (DUF421 family)
MPNEQLGIPITYGIVPIVTLLLLHNFIAFKTMKSEKLPQSYFRQASIIIHKGVIVEKNLSALTTISTICSNASHQKCNKHKRRSLRRT